MWNLNTTWGGCFIYTVPLSEDGRITGAGKEWRVSEVQSFLLYLFWAKVPPDTAHEP